MKACSLICLVVIFCICACVDSPSKSSVNSNQKDSSKAKSSKVVPIFEDPNVIPYKRKNSKRLRTFKDYLDAAIDAENQKAYTDAVEFAKKAIELDPQSGIAHYYYGKCEMASPTGDTKKGLAVLQKAIKLGYENPDMYEYIAVYYTGEKLPEKAVIALDRALVLAPTRRSYYQFRGSLLRELGRIDAAEKDYTTILSLPYGKRSKSYFLRGKFYESVGRNKDALKDYRKAASSKRPDFMVLKAIPKLLLKMGRDQEAIEELTKIIAIDPFDDDAITFRGKLYVKCKNYDKALVDFNKAIENSPRYARETYLARADLYDKLGESNKAKKDRASAKNINDRPAEKPVYDHNK